MVISEVIYGYLRAVSGLPPYELRGKIVRMTIDLTPVRELFGLFTVLPMSFGNRIVEVVEKYKLLPNDALIALTCEVYGIGKIATFDDDFKRVDFLEIVRF